MNRSSGRVLLFIGTDGAEKSAAGQFESIARAIGLSWSVVTRSLKTGTGEPLTASDLEGCTIAIGIGRNPLASLLKEQFPEAGSRVEVWEPEAVEREVPNLVARCLGGKRSEEATLPATPVQLPKRKTVTVRVGRETAGRRGKGVTTVWDLPLDEAAVRDLAATLKQRCGTGGTVKDGKIEIQGDHRDRVAAELEKLGYMVKRSGG
jgi:predicted translation initiation factor SUI1